jgi:hypothetical protein
VTRRPWRTWPLALSVGGVAFALTAVWSLPLVVRHDMTQSMRYEKVVPKGDWTLWGWVRTLLPAGVEHAIEGFVRALGTFPDAAGVDVKQPLWLPWWMWTFGAIAIVAGAIYRRRATLVLLVGALVLGFLFVQWPEHAVWNTRFLPFWLLTWGFLTAIGAAELLRWLAAGAAAAVRWVRRGDLHDARAAAWHARAIEHPDDREAATAIAQQSYDWDPPGWAVPDALTRRGVARRARQAGAIALAGLTVLGAAFAINRAWLARDDNPNIAIASWARWNYTGYENKPAWPEYSEIFQTMGTLPPGRALWEPSAMGTQDPINNYGTSLALELLPYWTDGRIGSMEGLYFESSATTSFHFLTVSELAQYPSNPVRGLVYGTLDDFDRGVRHLQLLGVRYYMAWTPEAQAKADVHPDLHLVASIPDRDGVDPKGWKVYEVDGSELVQGLDVEPVVAATRAGTTSECFGTTPPTPGSGVRDPELGAWECSAAAWWRDGADIDRPWAEDGPDEWERVDVADLGRAPSRRLDPVRVTDIVESPQEISFHVDEVGVPVVVKASYFPNWSVDGADGPYRLAPNLMVVVPTEADVSLTYGLTGVDWLGRVITLVGIAGVVVLVRWKRLRRYAAFAVSPQVTSGADGADGDGGGGSDAAPVPSPSGPSADVDATDREPSPALP